MGLRPWGRGNKFLPTPRPAHGSLEGLGMDQCREDASLESTALTTLRLGVDGRPCVLLWFSRSPGEPFSQRLRLQALPLLLLGEQKPDPRFLAAQTTSTGRNARQARTLSKSFPSPPQLHPSRICSEQLSGQVTDQDGFGLAVDQQLSGGSILLRSSLPAPNFLPPKPHWVHQSPQLTGHRPRSEQSNSA